MSRYCFPATHTVRDRAGEVYTLTVRPNRYYADVIDPDLDSSRAGPIALDHYADLFRGLELGLAFVDGDPVYVRLLE